MKRTALATAIAAIVSWQATAVAETNDNDQRINLENRIHGMEQRIQELDRTLPAKDAQQTESWVNRVEIGGLLEIEASHSKTDGTPSTSDLTVASVALGIGAKINDKVSAETTLLYENDDLGVDSATITLSQTDGPWSVIAGKQHTAFGRFETQLVSDPLTLDVGETAETVAALHYDADGLIASAFVFKGTNNKNGNGKIDHFGASLGYGVARDDISANAAIGYLNDISDSDGIQDALSSNDNVDYVAGWIASASVNSGPVTVIGEYVTASQAIAGLSNAKPSAWNLEAGYGFEAFGKDAVFAVAYQGSKDASALDIAEKRWLAGMSFELMENTGLGVELASETAYDGTDSKTLTALLSVEF